MFGRFIYMRRNLQQQGKVYRMIRQIIPLLRSGGTQRRRKK
jgi:hypothetical protein